MSPCPQKPLGGLPRPATCDARWIATTTLEDGIRDELARCAPTEDLHQAFQAHLSARARRRPDAAARTETRIRRLDEQLARARRLYEYGEYDWPTFEAKRDEIASEKGGFRLSRRRVSPPISTGARGSCSTW